MKSQYNYPNHYMLEETGNHEGSSRSEIEAELSKLDEEISMEQSFIEELEAEIRPTKSLKEVLSDRNVKLRDKLSELFKRRGVKIASIVTAIALIIASIGTAVGLTTSSTPSGAPKPSPNFPKRFYDFIKDGITKFADWLKGLAKTAVPAVISYILNLLGKAVGFVGDHLLIFMSALVVYIINRLTK